MFKNNSDLKKLFFKGLKFLQSSLIAFLTNMTVLTFCVEVLAWPKTLSYLLAITCATSMAFLVCRYFVFKQFNRPSFFKQYWKFISSAMVFRAIEFGFFTFFVEFYNFYYLYVFVAVQGCGTIFKFFFFNKFIFGNKVDNPT